MKATHIRILTVLATLALSIPMFGQKHQVSGRVLDAESGEPVIGAGVMLSSGGGTTTDFDGNYLIMADEKDVITFTSIGYLETKETVGGRSVINVSLVADNTLLEEVVVLGYTTQKKAELSSAVVSMSGEKLTNVASADVGNMLQGKVAGVVAMNSSGQPGASADIRIRGTGSITAGAGPMYVVDGVAGGDFNPNDVETITILKDASATALYGAAAAGGVIVVTTKSAKQDKPIVNFKASYGIKKALTGRFKAMDSEELYYTQKKMYSKMIFPSQRPESLLEQDFDWVNHSFRLGNVQNYYASVAGKTGRTSYFVSMDHYNENGTLINTNYRRNSARVNLSTAITDKLTMNARINYKRSSSREESSYVTLECAYRALPWDIPYVMAQDEEGNWYQTDEVLLVNDPKRSDNGQPWYSHDKYNILHNELYNYSKGRGEALVADLQLIWNITDWLNFTSTNRYDTSNDFWESYIDPRTQSPSYANNGHLSNSNSEWNGWGTTDILKFHKDFGGHDVSALAGWEYGEGYTRSLSAEGKNMPAGQRSISNCSPSTIEASGYDYKSRTWALLAQAQYSYLGKYILTASIRYDESYKFGPLNRGGYFPGVSGAWVVSNENFLKNNSFLTFLKLRAGYGKTGNDNIAAFRYQDIYELAANYEGTTAAVLSQQANPRLGWEEAYMTSFGVDATIKNNVNVTIDLYNTLNTNLLLAVPTATSTGFFEFMDNRGEVRNRGIEFAIDGTILKRGDFRWDAGFNIGLNKNRVMSLPDGDGDGTPDDILQTTSSGYNQKISVGRDIYSWFIPKWVGVNPENGDPVWEHVEDDGSITETSDYALATPQFVGTASPDFSGGLNMAFSWKGLTLSANGSFVYGNKIFNYTRCVMDSDGAYTDYNQMSHDNGLGWVRWDKDDESTWTTATHPKLVLNGNKNSCKPSSRQLEDGSFFRLRNVTLSYELPKTLINKIRMSSARVYVSADNIWTLSKFSGMDPEVRLEGSTYYLAGSYSNNYPVPMSISLGVDVKF